MCENKLKLLILVAVDLFSISVYRFKKEGKREKRKKAFLSIQIILWEDSVAFENNSCFRACLRDYILKKMKVKDYVCFRFYFDFLKNFLHRGIDVKSGCYT